MAGSNKGPPVLKEDGSYDLWKKQVTAWELLSDLSPEKRGLSLFLHGTTGHYNDLVSKIDLTDVNSPNDVKNILAVLDRYCASTEAHKAYTAFEKVHKLKRLPGQSVHDALLLFDSLIVVLLTANWTHLVDVTTCDHITKG